MRNIVSRVWTQTEERRVKQERRKLWQEIKKSLVKKGVVKLEDVPLMDKIVKEVYLS